MEGLIDDRIHMTEFGNQCLAVAVAKAVLQPNAAQRRNHG